MKHSTQSTLFISLSFLILLLSTASYPVLASRFDFNSDVSMNTPAPQSGNPGDFLTYVFQFANTGSEPVDMTIDFDANSTWPVLGDAHITIPAHSLRFIYPITVQIPADAPANLEKIIPIRFRTAMPGVTIPPLSLIARVNPIARIDFNVPSSQNGFTNTSIKYNIIVSNNGNKTESFAVTAVSENKWPVLLNFSTLDIQPGANQTLTVIHKIPAYTPVDSDKLMITVTWPDGKKVIELVTTVTDNSLRRADTHYIWNGQMSVYHYDLTDPLSYPFGLSGTIHGQWAPSSYAQISINDVFDSSNRRWFIEIDPQPWSVRTGEFNLSSPGLATPASAIGRVALSRKTDQSQYTLDIWQNTKYPGIYPIALDLSFDKHSHWSFLTDASPDNPKDVLQYDVSNYIHPNLRWRNSLAFNFNPVATPSYAASLGLSNTNGNWLWSLDAKHLENLNAYVFFQNFVLSLSQPYSATHFYSSWQFRSERSFQTENTTSFSLDGYFHWTDKHQLHSLFESSSATSRSYDNLVQLSYQYQWNTLKTDNVLTADWIYENAINHTEKNFRLSWEAVYHAQPFLDLLLTPQLALGSSQSNPDQYSRLLSGFRWNIQPNQTLTSQFDFNFNQYKLEIHYDWKITANYQLTLAYARQWQKNDSPSDTLNFNIRHAFTSCVPKPLGTLKGTFFLDKNHDGIMQNDEPPVATEFLINGKSAYQSDSGGKFQIKSLEPGDYSINLNSRFDVIYQLENPALRFKLKPYQTLALNIPVVRTPNLTGVVYLDQNHDHHLSPGEKTLGGIGLILQDNQGTILKQTTTYDDGTFIFYQLTPRDYLVAVDRSQLPGNLKIPAGLSPIEVNRAFLESDSSLEIALYPDEKPIEWVAPESGNLTISLNKEAVSPGNTLKITIDAAPELTGLKLILPGNAIVNQKTAPRQHHWEYLWRLPHSTPSGQSTIRCQASDKQGNVLETEADLIVLAPPEYDKN